MSPHASPPEAREAVDGGSLAVYAAFRMRTISRRSLAWLPFFSLFFLTGCQDPARTLLFAAPFVVAALAVGGVAWVTVRRPAWRGWVWALGGAFALVVFLVVMYRGRFGSIVDELPGRVIEVAVGSRHECARLSTGGVACDGPNNEGERGVGHDNPGPQPTLVHGIGDATRIYAGPGVSCALRRAGAPVCWGGRLHLKPPGDPFELWEVPGAAGVTALAVTAAEIAGVRADGTAFAWPRPLPPQYDRLASIAGIDDSRLRRTFAAIDAAGHAVWLRHGERDWSVRELPELGEVIDAAPFNDRVGCAVQRSGAVVCFTVTPRRRGADEVAVRPVAIEDAQRIFAIPHSNQGFCVHRRTGEVACWTGSAPPRALASLGQPREIHPVNNGICATGDGKAPLACEVVEVERQKEKPVSTLLEHDKLP